jgi:hypothetical protein
MLAAPVIRDALAAAVSTSDPADVRIELSATVVPPLVTTELATAAAEAARGTVGDIEMTIPGAAEDDAALALDAETIASWISFGPLDDSRYAMRIDEVSAASAIAAFAAAIDRDPVSARITVAGSGLGGVVPGQTGRELDVGNSTSALLATLGHRGRGAPVASPSCSTSTSPIRP